MVSDSLPSVVPDSLRGVARAKRSRGDSFWAAVALLNVYAFSMCVCVFTGGHHQLVPPHDDARPSVACLNVHENA